jgi:hypothetical protein
MGKKKHKIRYNKLTAVCVAVKIITHKLRTEEIGTSVQLEVSLEVQQGYCFW